jgi:flagellar protein FlbD
MVYVNPDLMLFIEKTPDTMVSFRDGQKLMVKEEPREVVKRMILHARRVRGVLNDLE